MVKSDRRHLPRQKQEASIMVLIPSDYSRGQNYITDSVPGKMYNQSEDGLYIEIDRPLKHGSGVSIKMAAPEEDNPIDAYYLHNTQVIWFKNIDAETLRFGIGVKIIRSVVQANVLTSRSV